MGMLYFLNGLIHLVIALSLIIGFFRIHKDEKFKLFGRLIPLVFFGYLVLTILNFMWVFNALEFSLRDFGLIYSLLILIQTIFIFRASHFLLKYNSRFYLLLSYLILVFTYTVFDFHKLVVLSLIVSSFLVLIIAFDFLNKSYAFKGLGYILIVYSCLCLILEFLLFFDIGNLLFTSFISSLLFSILIFYFSRDFRKYPIGKISFNSITTEESYLILFIKYFVYIIVLTNLVLISTIGVHEFSHVAVSRLYDCDSRSIAFEQGSYPYSEITCSDLSGRPIIALSGILVPIIVAIFLFFVEASYAKPLSSLIVGFNLLASYKDLLELGAGPSLAFAFSIVGSIFLFMGIGFLAKSRIGEHHHHVF